MADLAQLRRHARLFDHMGKAVGLDLQEEAIQGRLQFEEIAEAVLRCSRCSEAGACQHWLEQCDAAQSRSSTSGQDVQNSTPPDYCRNADLFSYLQQVSQ